MEKIRANRITIRFVKKAAFHSSDKNFLYFFKRFLMFFHSAFPWILNSQVTCKSRSYPKVILL